MSAESEEGQLLFVDKPKGITSFDVIRQLRWKLGVKKMGHAGTLDPLASGLMLVGVGEGTKQLSGLVGLDKEYMAEVRFGERRLTGDLEGKVVEEKVVDGLERSEVETALACMLGELTLPVSAYSAIKVGGVPMYKKARKAEKTGEELNDLPIKTMFVKEAELLKFELSESRAVATVRFLVSSGTYIRSLAEELGRRLSYPATLQNLRRTKVGDFDINDAKRLEEF